MLKSGFLALTIVIIENIFTKKSRNSNMPQARKLLVLFVSLVSLSLCLFPSLSLHLFLSFSLLVFRSFSLSLSLTLSLSRCLSISLSLWLFVSLFVLRLSRSIAVLWTGSSLLSMQRHSSAFSRHHFWFSQWGSVDPDPYLEKIRSGSEFIF